MNEAQAALKVRNDALSINHHNGLVFWNTSMIDAGLLIFYVEMTDENIGAWNKHYDEWEALTEEEKCQYDVLGALEQA